MLFAVTAVVFTTTEVAAAATTTEPAAADPHTAGLAELVQFVVVLNVAAVNVVKVPAAGVVPPIGPGEAGLNGVAGAPPSVSVQVVPLTVHVTISPVAGAVANPRIVFVVVAALPQIVWAADALFAAWKLPAALLSIPEMKVPAPVVIPVTSVLYLLMPPTCKSISRLPAPDAVLMICSKIPASTTPLVFHVSVI